MSAAAAVESVKADHVLVARSYGATPRQILTRVYVPSMMPVLLETLRISMIFNFTGVMIAEMYASRTGIGHLIANWGENFQMRQLFAGVILLAAVAILFNEAVRYLEADAAHGERDAAARRARTPRSRSKGLSHVYAGAEGGVPALEDISMKVGSGRFVVIVGPSGCGKTSLLMMLAGLRHQTAAPILCDGRADRRAGSRRASASCSRRRACFPGSPRSTTSSSRCACAACRSEERRRRAERCSGSSASTGFGGRYPHELSGGMKQRVSIARGLVQDPPVLLMDEPFAALDEQTRMTMGHELLRIWSTTRKTVVFITHSLTEAVYLADEVLVMSARPGRIIDRIEVTLPRPRTYEMMATDMFGRLRDRIWQQIRKTMRSRCAGPPRRPSAG